MRRRLVSIVLAVALVVPALVALLAAPALAQVFSNPASITLNDPNSQSNGNNNAVASPYPSTIAVSGLSGTVNHVAVTLNNVSYSHSQDIDVLLVGPGGQSMIVVANLGPNSGPTAPAANSTLTLSDSGSLPSMTTPWGAANTFKPVNFGGFNEVWEPPAPPGPYGNPGPSGGATATLGSVFNGTNPNGTWSLYVVTTAGGDGTGAVAGGWSLDVTTASAAATTTTLAASPDPSFTAAAGSSVTLTATVHKASDNSAVSEGTVDFTDGGVSISGCAAVAVSAGTATCTTSFSTEGNHVVAAAYSGTANFGSSNSAPVAQVVNNHTTVTGSNFCNTGSVTLNDPNSQSTGQNNATATPYPSNVFVSGLSGTVNHVAVTLNNVSYGHSQDIDVLLVGPGGQTLILVANLGPSSGPGAPAANATVTFSDAGSLPGSGQATPWSALGTVKPVNYGGFNEVWEPPAPSGPKGDPGTMATGATLASQFNGINGNGTWSLYVITTAGGDGSGAIAGGWCANITAAAAAGSTTTVMSDNNPSFTTAPGNAVTFTATVHKAADNSNVNEGTVTFTDNATPIAGCTAVAVGSGQANCPTSFAVEGSHTILAQYNGTANFAPSSATLTQVVNNHTTVTGNNFCNTGSIALNNPPNTVADATPYPSDIFVTGRPGPLQHLTVTLNNVSYSHSQDIDALLVGPGGQTLILVADAGPNTGGANSNVTLSLDDNAPSALGQASAWGSPGSSVASKPVNYGGLNETWGPPAPPGPYGNPGPAGGGTSTLGSTYDGTVPNGTWRLYVITTAAGDGTGAIAGGWCLGVQATPTIVTTASASAPAGSSISDTATLAGGVSATGTVTFSLFGPDNATCTGSAVFTSTKTVAGNGNYTSAGFTPVTTGTYRWIAAYSGDANNAPVSGTCNDANESIVVTTATPTVVTDASGPVPVGGTVSDTATISAGADTTGTITFTLFGPDNAACTGTAIFTSTKAVAGNGNYTSDSFTAAAAGTYRFIAAYSGDANNAAVTTACNDGNESVLVSTATPTIVTQASAPVTVGGTISDSATISGGVTPTGTITFTVFGPDDTTCAGTPAFSSTKSVTGHGNYTSDSMTTLAAGTYRWIASYSGDASNSAVTGACNDASEAVVVNKATTVVVTAASASVAAGQAISDTATISSGVNTTGTAVFSLFGPNDATCTGTTIFTSTKTVSGNGNYTSDSFTTAAAGTYRFIVAYSGDANNAAVTTACNDVNESVAVTTATANIVTNASAPVPVGGAISDTAAISAAVNPTGTITFALFGPNNASCTGTAVFTSTKTVAANGNLTSDTFTPTATGTYRWVAAYSGDANNAAVTTACNDANESVIVTTTTPTIATQASAPMAVGGTISDTATISTGVNPIGTVTFTVFGPDDGTCATTPAFTSTRSVSGNGTYTSDSFTTLAAGTYRWIAAYSGDSNNASVTTACNDANESVVVSKATAVVTTTASASVAAGRAISDTATITGGVSPTGTVTFTGFGPDNATCTGTANFTSTKTVAGNGTYTSDSFATSTVGTYRFIAAYSGDANNADATTACNDANESVLVSKATPAIVTQASVPVTIGGTISDIATLSAGANPRGTVTFTVFGPDNATCTGNAVFTSTKTVTGNGNLTSDTFTPATTGTYRWVAAYSGDANNDAAGPSSCTDATESVLVSPAQPTLVTQASASVPVGGAITDTAALASSVTPSGTITFQVFGPDNTTCTGTPPFSATKTVSGNGTYTSDPYMVPAVGTFRFVVAYSGDAKNAAITSACGAANESVTVTRAFAGYTPLVPVRICDTRAAGPGVAANQCNTHGHSPLSTGGQLAFHAASMAGVPADATAVVLHVTATGTSAASFLTLWPTGQTKPGTSSVNWAAGQTAPNLVEMGVGTGGQVSVFNYAGSVDVIVDLQGYVSPNSGGLYVSQTPTRVCDTRLGQPTNQCNHAGTASGKLGAGQSRVVNVQSGFGVPAGATAVVLNVTVTTTSSVSYLEVWPDGAPQPVASNLNWVAGQTVSNRVITGISAAGNIDVYNAYGSTDVVIDLGGYYGPPASGSSFVPMSPTRICDTRPVGPGVASNLCNKNGSGAIAPGSTLTLSGLDPTVTAYVVNVTVTNDTSPGYLVVFPANAARPAAPDVIWAGHQTIGNLDVATIGSAGLKIFNGGTSSTDVVLDVVGVYTTTLPPAIAASRMRLQPTIVTRSR